MKRQKRNRLSRAFSKGYLAGLNGKSKFTCPRPAGPEHQHWVNGWRQGREDHWSGFRGVSCLHRINQFLMSTAPHPMPFAYTSATADAMTPHYQ